MAVIPMKLATIVGPLAEFDHVALDCIVNREFHPEVATQISKRVKFLLPFELENPYAELLRKVEATADRLKIPLDFQASATGEQTHEELDSYVRRIDQQFTALTEEKESMQRVVADSERTITQLDHFRGVNMEISDFFKVRYVKFRFGHLPRDTFDNSIPLLDMRNDVYFFPTSIEKNVVYGAYMTPRGSMEKVDALLASMQFIRTRLSDRVRGNSEQAVESIRQEGLSAKARIAEIEAELIKLRDSEKQKVLSVYSHVRLMNDSYNIRRYAAHTQESFYLLGWVPSDKLDAFTENVSKACPNSMIVTDTPENVTEFTPPVKLKNNFIVRAFEPFMKLYGLPAYNELDPSAFFAFTYMILFGIMFGDVGQGAVLVIGGFLLWKLKGIWLARCVGYAGIFSIIFGFCYGSVFGYEELPFGFKVLQGTGSNDILQMSINLGLVVIVCVMLFNIINGIRQRNIGKMLFGSAGGAGVIFYLCLMAIILPVVGFAQQYASVGVLLAIAAVPFLLVFLHEPLAKLCARRADWKPQKMGEFFIEGFFEMIEVILSYFSNTLSFLRVGAYAISHASMMSVVYMLAETGDGHNIAVLVIGNIVIMCLEALLAGIQVLRLEFYEIFSRFYAGNGRPYDPLVIDYKKRND